MTRWGEFVEGAAPEEWVAEYDTADGFPVRGVFGLFKNEMFADARGLGFRLGLRLGLRRVRAVHSDAVVHGDAKESWDEWH